MTEPTTALLDKEPVPGLLADPDRAAELKGASQHWMSLGLSPRELCDLELLINGGFAPLRGFLDSADHAAVCESMRLADGTLWPIPITLNVTEDVAGGLSLGEQVALRDPEGVMLAALEITDLYRTDPRKEAVDVYGTDDPQHPGVRHLLEREGTVSIGGIVEGLTLPVHHDFGHLRLTPAETRAAFAARGWDRVVAFQTRNPMHRAHQELTLRAMGEADAHLLIHPVVGLTKPGDVDHYTRVRCYQALLRHYDDDAAMLALLPLAMRMAGPREALWHALIRRNYGCTHLIVGRDHAGPGSDSSGRPFYGPYDAQELLRAYADEAGVEMVPFAEMAYVAELDSYVPTAEVPAGATAQSISGTQLRERLAEGGEIPEWFTYPDVAAELQRSNPPRSQQGVTVLFTGLSGSGKSTIAGVLQAKLLERGGRTVTMLDGDLVRQNLSSELGFSREHRDLNILRIGWVAAEVSRHGGIAICAPIAPYDEIRKRVRQMVEEQSTMVLVHVSTPIEVCEERDRKGLYAKARAGLIGSFTGVSDPYEVPQDAELVIDTATTSAEEAAEQILTYLVASGHLVEADV
jgi:sulfate adenylyltransferase